MAEIETDYLVIGAGASGMAFTDSLIAEAEVDVVLVDRRESAHVRSGRPIRTRDRGAAVPARPGW